jgi:hypothetical protein
MWLTVTLGGVACAGRTELVPAYQIGRLSSDAVVASDAGVRIMVRTAAWPGPPLESTILPIELTIDNGSSRAVSVGRAGIAMVTERGDRLLPLNPALIVAPEQVRRAVNQHALSETALAARSRTSGFVYFAEPEAEALELRIDLIGANDAEPIGEIDIPFAVE